MSLHKSLRKQFFVDPKVQGALVWRTILYWCMCMATVILMLLCWRIMTGPSRMFYHHLGDLWFFQGPALIASLVMLPVIIIDIVQMSNRFAGPMLRLRRSMRALARGEHVEPIYFRDNDYWHDFAEEFNAVAARVQGGTEGPPIVAAVDTYDGQATPTHSIQIESVPPIESSTRWPVTSTTSDGDEEGSQLETAGSRRP